MYGKTVIGALLTTLAGGLLAGCASTPTADQGIPRVTALYEKATQPQRNVHKFRKPLRDEQARLLRQLAKECDEMLADMGGEASSEALTGQPGGGELQTALTQLSGAARKADVQAMRAAHASALAAYHRTQAPGE